MAVASYKETAASKSVVVQEKEDISLDNNCYTDHGYI
jgi:hypothetical protein